MKCILLSAGKGKRLMPLTKLTPKCLLSISSTNLMEYWLKKIKLIGFEEIIINTHHLSEILISEIELISKKLYINNIKLFKILLPNAFWTPDSILKGPSCHFPETIIFPK